MNLLTFLQECTHPSFYQERSLILFKHKTHYPLLFASYCAQLLKKNAPLRMSTFDLTAFDEHELKAQLSTSFLGNRSIYWIGNINALDARKQKPLMQYLMNYHGPHIVIGWSDAFEGKNKNHELIELNDTILMNELLLL